MISEPLEAILASIPLPLAAAGLAGLDPASWRPMALARTVGIVLAWTQVGAMALLATGTLTAWTIMAWWALGGVAWAGTRALWASRALPWRRELPDHAGALLGWGLVVLLAAGLLAMAAVPPWYRDEMVYHLALPQQFAAAHGYVRPDDNIFASFPLGWESIVAASMSAGLHNPRALGVWVTLADALAIAGIASRLGATPAGRATAAASFLLIPTVCEFGASAYVEPWLLLVTLLGLDAALAARVADARPSVGVEAGVWAGFAASAKYPGLVIALGLLAVLPSPRSRLRALAPLVVFGSPFYLRNLVQRGNPVFPLGWDLFGGEGWDTVRAWAYHETLSHYGSGRTPGDLALLIPRLFTTRDMHGTFQGSVGPVLLLGILGLRRHRALVAAALGWTLWWALTVEQVRFWLPAGALLAVGVGLLATGLARSASVLLLGVLWAWGPVSDLWRFQLTGDWWTGAVTREQLQDHLLPESARVYRELPDLVPPDGRVWLVWMRAYSWDFPRDYRLDCVFEGWRLERALDADAVPTDVTHLLVNERFFLHGTSADWTDTDRLAAGRTARLAERWRAWIAEGRIIEVKRWGQVVLYRTVNG